MHRKPFSNIRSIDPTRSLISHMLCVGTALLGLALLVAPESTYRGSPAWSAIRDLSGRVPLRYWGLPLFVTSVVGLVSLMTFRRETWKISEWVSAAFLLILSGTFFAAASQMGGQGIIGATQFGLLASLHCVAIVRSDI